MGDRLISIESGPRPGRPPRTAGDVPCIALVGNPNAGKTTLFNALTGLRARTANFPGSTFERRVGRTRLDDVPIKLLDLPGLYGLGSAAPEERLAQEALLGRLPGEAQPDAVLLLLDATNLERNLYLASQVLELGRPTVIALNMVDLAERARIKIDVDRLQEELGCPVVPVVARSGEGLDALRGALSRLVLDGRSAPVAATPAQLESCGGCPFRARFDWAEQVGERCSNGRPHTHGAQTDRVDAWLTHPVGGVLALGGVMFSVFALIFWIAQYPMGWIESGFGLAAGQVAGWLPPGELRSLVIDGVIGGVGGVLVFLPQICILFFMLSLLEDTGYLSRAAFVLDRLMRRVGLPGKAFLPMLSAHACAIPAIMSTRVIESRRDRLVTILVLPLLTCSARIPVYAMVTALLFANQPFLAAGAFTGAYALGIVAALGVALVFRRTILPGETRPLVLELPSYKMPRLRTALLTTTDRALVFVKNAGSVILVMSLALWALSTYPRSEPEPESVALAARAAQLEAAGRLEEAGEARTEAEVLTRRDALSHSVAGRLGRAIEPVLEPLGFDWQIGIGVVSSFAAREVIVSTLAIVYGVGEEAVADEPRTLYAKLQAARRADGSPVFTTAVGMSLLVFYVLAMQCLPTQAVTRRETGSWRWPVFQFAYMSALAYVASLSTYQLLRLLGFD